MKPEKNEIRDISEIPSFIDVPEIKGQIELSETDKLRLSEYKDTALIEGIEFEDGIKRDIKARLSLDENGDPLWSFMEKKQQLEIPRKFGNIELMDSDIKKLRNGGMAGPFDFEEGSIYFAVDPELNSIKVVDSRETGIPDKFGGYELTKDEKQALAEGKEMPLHVFCSDDGKHYFSGNYYIDQKSGERGLKNFKILTKKEAKELEEILNRKPLNTEGEEKGYKIYDAVILNNEGEHAVYSREDIMNMIKEGCTGQLREIAEGGFRPDLNMESKIASFPPEIAKEASIALKIAGNEHKEIASRKFMQEVDNMVLGKMKVKKIYKNILLDRQLRKLVREAPGTREQKAKFLQAIGASEAEAHAIVVSENKTVRAVRGLRILNGKERTAAVRAATAGDIQAVALITKGAVPDTKLAVMLADAKAGEEMILAAGFDRKMAKLLSASPTKSTQSAKMVNDIKAASVQDQHKKLKLDKKAASKKLVDEFRRLGSDM